MNTENTATQFVGKLTYYGLVISPLVTFIGWQIVYPFNFSLAILVAMVFLAPLGVAIGFSCGLISGAMTSLLFDKLQSHSRYMAVLIITNMVSAFVIAMMLVGILHSILAVVEVPLISEVSLLGGILAAISAGGASYYVGKWYLKQQK